MTPNEFIISPIIEISLQDFSYNHFFFNKFPQAKFEINKIKDYPDFTLGEAEVKKRNEESDIEFDLNEPSNYYCLGILD